MVVVTRGLEEAVALPRVQDQTVMHDLAKVLCEAVEEVVEVQQRSMTAVTTTTEVTTARKGTM